MCLPTNFKLYALEQSIIFTTNNHFRINWTVRVLALLTLFIIIISFFTPLIDLGFLFNACAAIFLFISFVFFNNF